MLPAARIALYTILAAQALPAQANDGQAIAARYSCLACHQAERKVLGPAFKAVAAKYRHDPTAPARLADKVRRGSKGVWGPAPMPAQQVPEADLKHILQWILSL